MKGARPNRKLFDLGLAISGALLQPGETRTQREIAYFINAAGAHCSYQAIQQIEKSALKKMRLGLGSEYLDFAKAVCHKGFAHDFRSILSYSPESIL